MLLHITNDFNLTQVHTKLYSQIDKLGVEQTIFVPLRNERQIGNNHFTFINKNSKIVYSKRISLIHRVLFHYKIHSLYKSLIKEVDIDKIKITHATTLYSDGAIAYKLFKNYNIPYIVAVRNTDVNFYFKKRKELIPLGLNILKNAKKIIFISESNKESFFKIASINKIEEEIRSKIKVINNGIDDYWIVNKKEHTTSKQQDRFLFIGRFDKNKNVLRLIESLKIVRNKSGRQVTLDLVGGTGNKHKEVLDLVELYDWIDYKGKVYDKKQLEEIFDNTNYFSMISHHETFGLVYLEALSQGKPILYTQGEGIDGMFKVKVGEKVDSCDIDNITAQIENLLSNKYEGINTIDFNKFIWANIAKEYIDIYEKILK